MTGKFRGRMMTFDPSFIGFLIVHILMGLITRSFIIEGIEHRIERQGIGLKLVASKFEKGLVGIRRIVRSETYPGIKIAISVTTRGGKNRSRKGDVYGVASLDRGISLRFSVVGGGCFAKRHVTRERNAFGRQIHFLLVLWIALPPIKL